MQVIKYMFQQHGDDRGYLISLEEFNDIPFEIKRVYYMYDTRPGVRRGFHAHAPYHAGKLRGTRHAPLGSKILPDTPGYTPAGGCRPGTDERSPDVQLSAAAGEENLPPGGPHRLHVAGKCGLHPSP